MIFIFVLFGLLIVVLLFGRINLSLQFRNQVNELFGQSENISDKVFHKNEFGNLPEPVRRYFSHVLKDGQPYISYARIKHDGHFKAGLNKGWMSIKGEQYATTEKPGFIWKGTTSEFTARDMYIGDKGGLIVSLFSLFGIVNAKGEQYNQGELLRWLGESILYPTNFLPDERLQWWPINTTTAKLTYSYNGLSLFFNITFNEIGEITGMETKRYMDEKNIETWVIKESDYKELNNVLIPTEFEVLWRLQKGDFSYAKFRITEVEYNIPAMF